MVRTRLGRRLVMALVLVLGMLIVGATVSFAAPAESTEDWCYGYHVRKGDTLSGIAYRHGISWHALASYNGIKNPNHIRAGSCLAIPPKTHYSYYKPVHHPSWHYVPGRWVWVAGHWVWR
jgi:hypothetical protein